MSASVTGILNNISALNQGLSIGSVGYANPGGSVSVQNSQPAGEITSETNTPNGGAVYNPQPVSSQGVTALQGRPTSAVLQPASRVTLQGSPVAGTTYVSPQAQVIARIQALNAPLQQQLDESQALNTYQQAPMPDFAQQTANFEQAQSQALISPIINRINDLAIQGVQTTPSAAPQSFNPTLSIQPTYNPNTTPNTAAMNPNVVGTQAQAAEQRGKLAGENQSLLQKFFAGLNEINPFQSGTAYAPTSEQNAANLQTAHQAEQQAVQSSLAFKAGGLISGFAAAANPIIAGTKFANAVQGAKTPEEYAGAIGELLANTALGAGIPEAAGLFQAKEGETLIQNVVNQAIAKGTEGTAIGGVYGVAGGMEQGQSFGQVIMSGLTNALLGGAIGTVAGAAAPAVKAAVEQASAITSNLGVSAPDILQARPGFMDITPPEELTNSSFAPANPDEFAKVRQDAVNAYKTTGYTREGDIQPENAGLRILEEQAKSPQNDAVASQELAKTLKDTNTQLNPDGSLTVYRGGNQVDANGLVSVSVDKAAAAEFGPVTEFRVNPDNIKVGAGLDTGELLVDKSGLLTPDQHALRQSGELDQLPPTLKDAAPGGLPERGFVTTVKDSPTTTDEVKTLVNGSYAPQSQKSLLDEAKSILVQAGPDALEHMVNNDATGRGTVAGQVLVDYYQKAGQFEKAAEIANQLATEATKRGQANAALALYDKLSPEGIARFASAELAKVGRELSPEDAQSLYNQAQEAAQLQGVERTKARIKLNDAVRSLLPPDSPLNVLLSLRKALMILNPASYVKHGMVALNGALELAKSAPASWADIGMSLFSGVRTTTATMDGVFKGARVGLSNAIETLKTGIDPRNVFGSDWDMTKVNYGNSPIGKAAEQINNFINLTMRPRQAMNTFGYQVAFQHSLFDQAMSAAKNAGIGHDELQTFIKDLVDHPTDSMLINAVSDGKVAVFENDTALNNMIQKTIDATSEASPWAAKALDMAFPIRKTPSSIFTQAMNYTPIGGLNAATKAIGAAIDGNWTPQVQRNLANAIGRSTLGTGLIGLGISLGANGLITLDAATSQEKKDWATEGKQPNAILINGQWQRLNAAEPLGMLLSLGAAIQKGYEQTGSITGGLAALPKQIFALAKNETYLNDASNLATALDESGGSIKQGALNILTGIAGTLVPAPLASIAKGTDQYQRQYPVSPLEAIKQNIPGLREQLPAKTGAFGEPLPQQQGVLSELTNPFKPTTNNQNSQLDTQNSFDESAAGQFVQQKIQEKYGNQPSTPDQIRGYIQKGTLEDQFKSGKISISELQAAGVSATKIKSLTSGQTYAEQRLSQINLPDRQTAYNLMSPEDKAQLPANYGNQIVAQQASAKIEAQRSIARAQFDALPIDQQQALLPEIANKKPQVYQEMLTRYKQNVKVQAAGGLTPLDKQANSLQDQTTKVQYVVSQLKGQPNTLQTLQKMRQTGTLTQKEFVAAVQQVGGTP